ncbi:MAG TPA: MG2 domain-containing protein [Thermoanaerobaculia bacterium]|nr:MG2 domain-containing protein [Thermoanaerobaculia bacterium]
MRTPAARRVAPSLALLVACAFTLACSAAPAAPPDAGDPGAQKGTRMEFMAAWDEVDRLVEEQKFRAALDRTEALLEEARQANDADDWARALIRRVQYSSALSAFETAVKQLKASPWPERPLERSILHLFYGQALAHYLDAYSWEIEQREQVVSGETVELAKWTKGQILGEAGRAYLGVWRDRAAWGAEPLGVLAEHLEQNDYPPRIRGTLRDAVSYLWVELLADSSRWTAAESNDVGLLDLGELLGDGPRLGADDQLASSSLHPLAKLAAVLADLESWHQKGGRPEAAFEARLERLRRLAEARSDTTDRQAIKKDLEARLAALGKRFEWWSAGQAQLAELLRQEERPQALVAALAAARAGAEAHPESKGGRSCQALADQLTMPELGLSAMAADGAGKRSLALSHKNVERAWLRAWRIDPLAELSSSREYPPGVDNNRIDQLVASRKADAEWSVELPATPDLRPHRTFVTPPLSQPGFYLVATSARADFRADGNSRSALTTFVTDLVLFSEGRKADLDVTVRSGSSGQTVSEASVSLYRFDWQTGYQQLETRQTDRGGRVHFDGQGGRYASYLVVAKKGADQVFQQQYLYTPPTYTQPLLRSALVYTDRTVYRPGQEVQWKVVAYREETRGRFTVEGRAEVEVSLVDANGEQVDKATVTTNPFGSASGRFRLPAGRLLGSWRLATNRDAAAVIAVEEYKRPTFEAKIEDPPEPLRLNRPAKLVGSARYYFGLPVSGGRVAWRVVREPVFPPFFWYHWRWRPQAPQTVAGGKAELAADGTFHVDFTPAAREGEGAAGGLTYRFRLEADVTDEGGETRTASRSFRLGFVAIETILESEVEVFEAGEPAEIAARRTDLDGVARAGTGRWELHSLAQPPAALLPADQPLPDPPPVDGEQPYQTPGDRLRPRWEGEADAAAILAGWATRDKLAEGRLTHGADGKAAIALAPLPAGAYRLIYRTEDPWGATFETRRDLLVAGPGETPVAVPLLLAAERASVPVGGTVRLLAGSALPGQELELVIARPGRAPERRRLVSQRGPARIEVPVTEGDRGGVAFSLTGVRDHQLLSTSLQIFVPREDKELKVELATFRDRLRPGTRESWRLTVKSPDQKALAEGAAEVLTYLYDRSLDLFAPHQPPSAPQLLTRGPELTLPEASLGETHPRWQDQRWSPATEWPEPYRGDRLKFFDNYGVGGPGGRGRHAPMMRMATAEGVPGGVAGGVEGGVAGGVPAPAAPKVMAKAADAAQAAEAASEPVVPEVPPPPVAEATVRKDFRETAFFFPHLLTGADGSVAFDFEVPDAVTEWSFWVHAVTKDLAVGSRNEKVKTVRELTVRPSLPRFLREGDRLAVEVLIDNSSETRLSGQLDVELFDPATEASRLADFGLTSARARGLAFAVEPGRTTSITIPLTVPAGLGEVAFRAVAKAGSFSDGELRPLPVLPGRMHLVESRFAALQGGESRELAFPALAAGDDPSRLDEQLVVTLDAQLFYGVLSALPYLVEYPYECTEQTLNRYLSTAILSSLFGRYPEVARAAEAMAKRETVLEPWDAADPNRKMALEETPWLAEARGGQTDLAVLRVLDPQVAASVRRTSLAKLEEAQAANGGFPWWPGGPPSPYITLYLLFGFSKGLEFGIEPPREMVVKAWGYMHRYFEEELVGKLTDKDCCPELATFLAYVLSAYPDESWTGGLFTPEDQRRLVDTSFRHWKEHSPLLKAYLTLTLHRQGRPADARLVLDSILDSARTTPDQGTFWAPEERAWLWYNDDIEGHAFILRTLGEIAPRDPRRAGLVQWLFLNKKLNHWRSTRGTAEVLYSLALYLRQEERLAVEEKATVTAGPRRETFRFPPGEYSGKARMVIPGPELAPAKISAVRVDNGGPNLMFASATWHYSTEQPPAAAAGDFFAVSRRTFKRLHDAQGGRLEPLAEGASLAPGDQVEVELTISAKHAAEYVHLRDPRGAGFEPETLRSGYQWDLGIGRYEEVRDSATNFFIEWLPAGTYTLRYRLRAVHAGAFKVAPATLQGMYAPEFAARSAGDVLTVAPADRK